jgi:hypothetical protein
MYEYFLHALKELSSTKTFLHLHFTVIEAAYTIWNSASRYYLKLNAL